VGVTGYEGRPPPEYLEVLRFVDRELGLGNPDIEAVFAAYKKDFNKLMNRRFRVPMFFVLLLVPVIFALLWISDTCCLSIFIVGIVGVYVLAIVIAEIPVVVERPNGFEKDSIKDYTESFETNEARFAEEGLYSVKIDVSDFFQVKVPTYLYIFELGPPPFYAVMWKMDSKSLCHIGYRTEGNSERLKALTSKTGRS
jgi:hypothetical protein